MNKARSIILCLGIPGLLTYGTLAAAQWQASRALSDFERLQKAHRPDSLTPVPPAVLAAKEAYIQRAARFAPDHPEPPYQTALLRLVQAEAASLQPSRPPEATADEGPDPQLRVLLRDALRAINRAIDLNPGYADYYFVKATIHQNLEATLPPQAGNAAVGAVSHLLVSADKLDPYKPSLHYRVGSFYLALGERESAKRALSVALTDTPRYAREVFGLLWSTIENPSELRELIEDEPLASALLSIFLWEHGSQDEALREFEALLSRPTIEYQTAEILIDLARRAKRFDAARTIIRSTKRHRSTRTSLQKAKLEYLLAQTYWEEGRIQEAINCLEGAVLLNSNISYIHEALGNAYLRTGDPDRAIARYMLVLRGPDGEIPVKRQSDIHVRLANAYEQKKDYLHALEHYFKASRLDPFNAVAQQRVREITRDHLN